MLELSGTAATLEQEKALNWDPLKWGRLLNIIMQLKSRCINSGYLHNFTKPLAYSTPVERLNLLCCSFRADQVFLASERGFFSLPCEL